jgi:hypothetical protein
MQLSRKLLASAVAAGCIVAGAAPSAMAKSHKAYYSGKTRDGDPISFTLVNGSKVTNLKAYVPTLCGSTQGFPMHGTDPFDPPGSFPLSKTTKVKAKRANAIWNTSDVTKNFVVSFKRGRKGIYTMKLHVDYSFLFIVFSYPITSHPYVCTGDSQGTFKPVKG